MTEDRMQRQRFEKKYRVSEDIAVQVREFVSSYLELDEHGVGKPDFSYPVHSLYLDSDQLATYWMMINGEKNRFKLRLRFYNSDPDTAVFFEIKRRIDHCILKQRAGVWKEAVPWLLAGQLPAPAHLLCDDPMQSGALERFSRLTQELGARPKVHVAYQREAWVNPHDSLRVTLDRHVLGEPEPTTGFNTEMTNPCRPFGDQVILELKFTDRFPGWCREMVERFELVRCSAAKYCEIVEMIGEEKLDARLHERLVTAEPAAFPAWPSDLALPAGRYSSDRSHGIITGLPADARRLAGPDSRNGWSGRIGKPSSLRSPASADVRSNRE